MSTNAIHAFCDISTIFGAQCATASACVLGPELVPSSSSDAGATYIEDMLGGTSRPQKPILKYIENGDQREVCSVSDVDMSTKLKCQLRCGVLRGYELYKGVLSNT